MLSIWSLDNRQNRVRHFGESVLAAFSMGRRENCDTVSAQRALYNRERRQGNVCVTRHRRRGARALA